MSHSFFSCNPPRARNLIVPFLMIGCAAHEIVFSVACNSDSEILAALQTVETVVCTQRHRLHTDTFPMLSVGWTWQGFCRVLDPRWVE